MEKITSKNNPLIKDIKKLMTSAAVRRAQARFVLEGARLCFDVLNSDYSVQIFLITPAAQQKYAAQAEALAAVSAQCYLISDEVAAKLSETEHAQGVFAVCNMQESRLDFSESIIALDRVQDPGNLGVILRTAEALGISNILAGGCCDFYNPKTLRASMGGVLRLTPMVTEDMGGMLCSLQKTHRIYAAVPSAQARSITEIDFSLPSVCIIGNEANGVLPALQALADDCITIRMQGKAESLNAGVAAAITMWEMKRQ